MSCEECMKKDKRIRIIKSDYDFQLRKTIEDKAEEKALYQIGVQKEIRKWQDKYQKQKLDHQENSKKWLNKIDQQSHKCQQQIKINQKQCQKRVQENNEDMQRKYQAKKEEITQNYEKIISDMKESYYKEKVNIENSYKKQISSIEQQYTSEIAQNKKEAEEKYQKLGKELDSTIVGLRSEKHAEEKANEKLQEEMKKDRNRYLSDIYDLKGNISKLEQNIKQLNQNLKYTKEEVEQKKQQIIEINRENLHAMECSRKEQERLRKEWEQNVQNHVKQFYQRELEITKRYEESVQHIQEKRQNEKILYKSNINEIRSCIQNRQSKMEDIEEILIWKQKYVRKEKEYEALEKEVKFIQLQLENKDDMYNKMFIPSVNSTHLNDCNTIKKKELKMKRLAKQHVSSTVRQILHAVNVNSSNLPLLNNIDKKYLPPKSNKIL